MMTEQTRIISALGVVQILSWGSTFYLMAPLAQDMARDTGWEMSLLSAGVSLGLLVSGLGAPAIGSWIARSGGRATLSFGMICIAAGLVMLGLAPSPPIYLVAWSIIGVGMAAGLYDAAFSTLGHIYGQNARSAITHLTLWGGFASTICWPLSAWLVELHGWRITCLIYAVIHLTVTVPICLFLLPRAAAQAGHPARDFAAPPPARIGAGDLRFFCVAVIGVILSLLATIWSIHMVTILTSGGLTIAAAIGLGTLIGPAQVGARVLEMLGRGRHHPIWTTAAATGLILLGFAGLQMGLPASVALIAFGAGNGLWSIARGALPLALFGAGTYAETMGRLARPMLLASAVAPLVGGVLIEGIGPAATMTTLAALAIIPCIATAILYRCILRDRRQVSRSNDFEPLL
ncbi:MFS transporter [Sedimentitalea sp. XS_ASV28]|uniref:MFS transporter n=1 Tax=Sedimentitalea sp. XS_ASV28 TaxID=3241296 RepID=UPI0035177D76